MPKRVAITNLNARTIDILNTIRANATAEYQSAIPAVTNEYDLPKVGDILFGYPNLANQFIAALMNRIALVKIKSATFNNEFAMFKKGYLEFGETVEEVFVQIAKAREFSVENAPAREFKRTLPDVRSAFHSINWRVQYPITIQNEDLRQAFTSFGGVEDLIARIVDSVYTAAEYDEYLLYKYQLIKAISHGKMFPVAFDASDLKNAAKSFRGMSNQLPFMNTKYNVAGVHTTTPKNDQYIFMDAQFNANYDVDVLASAFNMDRATFSGKLKLIDNWTEFDNDRFSIIRGNSEQLEEVTDAELALMANVKAVLIDAEWFQNYDNLATMTEQYVASGLYWNYFYTNWKTISSSPFSNAVVFVANTASTTIPNSFTVKVKDKIVSDNATILTLDEQFATAGLAPTTPIYGMSRDAVTNGIAVHKYGAVIFPTGKTSTTVTATINGKYFEATVATTADVGDTITFSVPTT